MFTITEEDITKASEKLKLLNGGDPQAGGAVQSLMESLAHADSVTSMAIAGLMAGAHGDPIHAIQHSLAIALVIGMQIGMTRAVDETARAVIEAHSPSGKSFSA